MRVALSLLLTGMVFAEEAIVLIPLEGERRNVRGTETRILKALKRSGRPARISDRRMAELQEAAGCAEDTPACLALIGLEAGAMEFVYGSVFSEGRRLRMLLQRFSVPNEREEGRVQVQMRRASTRIIGKAVAELMRPFEEDKAPADKFAPVLGTLEVQVDVPGALIRVNGQPRGVAPLRLEEIGVATYDLEAEKDGYKTWKGQAEVKAGQVTTVKVSLEVSPQEMRALTAAEPKTLRTPTWVAGGVTVALLAGATVFAVWTVSDQNDFDDGVADIEPGDPGAAQRAAALKDDADTGENRALVANILFGAAGAAAIATGILVYMDLNPPATASGAVSVQPGGVQIRF